MSDAQSNKPPGVPFLINNPYAAKGKKRKEREKLTQTLPLSHSVPNSVDAASNNSSGRGRAQTTRPTGDVLPPFLSTPSSPKETLTESPSDEVTVNEGIDDQLFQSTPFGLYCLKCKTKIAVEHRGNFFRHIGKYHAGYNGLTFKELKLRVERMKTLPPNQFYCSDAPKEMYTCGICCEIFSRPDNTQRHIANEIQKDGPCAQAKVVRKLCVKTICNRVVEYLPQEKAVTQASVLLSYSDMTLIIKPFVRHDENAEKYVNIFSQIIRSTGNQFASKLRQNIVQYGELEATELQLTKLVQIADVWLTQYARLEVAEVPANLRASLMLYEGVEVNQVAQNTTFSMRDNINVLSQELKKMLCFLWRHDGHGTNIIAKTRKDISDLLELHDSSPQIIQSALIGKLLVDVMLENPASTSQYPFGCVYAAARCFFISKDQLVLRSADASASQVATIMHLFRLAYCSVVRTMNHPLGYIEGAKVLVKTVMERPMMNTLGPMIRHLREIQMQKPKVVHRHFSRNGEIVVQGLVFKPEIWKTLIPRVVSAARLVLSQIFDGKDWEVFLTTTLPLLNVGISGGADEGVQFQVQQAGGDVLSESLKLSPQLNEMDQDHLSSIVEFCLHGLGLGSMRHSETLGLQDFQVLWGNGALYFYAKSKKKWKAKSKLSTELTQHKLPKSISRIVLLFRLVTSLKGGNLSSFVPKGRGIPE